MTAAVILAAGRGSRMQLLTECRPKCLIEIGGRSLLEWQLSALRGAGIDEIAIVTGWRGEMLREYGLHIFENRAWSSTNIVQSLSCAAAWLRTRPVVVAYSDILYSTGDIRRLTDATHDIAISFDPNWLELWQARFVDPLADAETFQLENGRWVSAIGNRPSRLEDVEGQYMGLLRIEPSGWARIYTALNSIMPLDRARIDVTALLDRLLRIGDRIEALPAIGPWCEIDHESDIAVAERILSNAPIFP